MVLYFRLLWVCLRLVFRPKRLSWSTDVSVIPSKIWPNDLDLNLHVNNSRYLTLMDLGRFDLAVRALGFKQVIQKRWSPVVGTLHIRYFKPLGLFQKYQLKTRVLGWDEKWFYLEQVFESNGEVTTLAVLKILFMGPIGKVPSALFLESVGCSRRSPQLPPEVRRWLQSRAQKKN